MTVCNLMVRILIFHIIINCSLFIKIILIDFPQIINSIHIQLFIKIYVPLCRMLIIIYMNQILRIQWSQTLTSSFQICNSVKQGGLLSPIL